MKRIRGMVLALLMVVVSLATSGSVWAGRGMGPGNGTGPICNILDCKPFVISGIVVTVGYYGGGIQIVADDAADAEPVSVYGIGPVRFWAAQDVDRPSSGDWVSTKVCEVTASDGTSRLIALSVTVDGVRVELRDTDGYPLWRGGWANGPQGGGGGLRLRDGSCLAQ